MGAPDLWSEPKVFGPRAVFRFVSLSPVFFNHFWAFICLVFLLLHLVFLFLYFVFLCLLWYFYLYIWFFYFYIWYFHLYIWPEGRVSVGILTSFYHADLYTSSPGVCD